ncbi:MAG TPA: cytochrome c oxidase subunit II [Dehalococcoidia bacterium]|nr:cytochrome c oxidase subunit II [Dehalococcoidia bacterium]
MSQYTSGPSGRRKPPLRMLVAIGLILILGAVIILASFTVLQLPRPISEQANNTHLLYEAVLTISMIVFFLVTSGIIWAVFRYKREPGDETLPEQIHGSNVLEMTWTIIPILILVALFIPALLIVLDMKSQPAEADAAVVVDVIGHQWWWEFDYNQDGFKVQQTPPDYANLDPPHLVVPVGETVLLRIHSTDVVHSFYVPHLLYKIQAIPGNINEMHFKVKDGEVGTYTGQCFQFCGLHHSDMRFVLDVRTQADYDSWVTQQKTAAPATTGTGSK